MFKSVTVQLLVAVAICSGSIVFFRETKPFWETSSDRLYYYCGWMILCCCVSLMVSHIDDDSDDDFDVDLAIGATLVVLNVLLLGFFAYSELKEGLKDADVIEGLDAAAVESDADANTDADAENAADGELLGQAAETQGGGGGGGGGVIQLMEIDGGVVAAATPGAMDGSSHGVEGSGDKPVTGSGGGKEVRADKQRHRASNGDAIAAKKMQSSFANAPKQRRRGSNFGGGLFGGAANAIIEVEVDAAAAGVSWTPIETATVYEKVNQRLTRLEIDTVKQATSPAFVKAHNQQFHKGEPVRTAESIQEQYDHALTTFGPPVTMDSSGQGGGGDGQRRRASNGDAIAAKKMQSSFANAPKQRRRGSNFGGSLFGGGGAKKLGAVAPDSTDLAASREDAHVFAGRLNAAGRTIEEYLDAEELIVEELGAGQKTAGMPSISSLINSDASVPELLAMLGTPNSGNVGTLGGGMGGGGGMGISGGSRGGGGGNMIGSNMGGDDRVDVDGMAHNFFALAPTTTKQVYRDDAQAALASGALAPTATRRASTENAQAALADAALEWNATRRASTENAQAGLSPGAYAPTTPLTAPPQQVQTPPKTKSYDRQLRRMVTDLDE